MEVVSIVLTSGNLGRAHDRAKCSGGRQTGSETRAVQRWSWHEKQTYCSVWESLGVGTEPGSVLFVCLGDDSVSKKCASLRYHLHQVCRSARITECTLRSGGEMYFYAWCTLSAHMSVFIAAYLFMLTSFTAPTFNSSS